MSGAVGARKQQIRAALAETRARTLRLFEAVPDDFLTVRVHDFYSPIGWHFGHIGRTEAFWACEEAMGQPCLNDALSFLFANVPENSKDNRTHLPTREAIRGYLSETRRRTLAALAEADLTRHDPLLADGYAWEFALQHECQHQETVAELLQLIQKRRLERAEEHAAARPASSLWGAPPKTPMMLLPDGTFCMGSDERHGYDNEKEMHPVAIAPFALDRTPVTNAQWMAFLRDGGYDRPELWTGEGFAWRVQENATRPEYWHPSSEFDFLYVGPNGLREMHPEEPVCGVSWYEADAYARWAGKRLPTEAEWEYAAAWDPALNRARRYPWGDRRPNPNDASFALEGGKPDPVGMHPDGRSGLSLLDMAGGVWEWTASPFLPYPGFAAFPYDGYSKDHMDGTHKVCRGGSWATSGPILRCAFRNWYVPSYRQGFLGLRCAR